MNILQRFTHRYAAEHGADKAEAMARYRLHRFIEHTGARFTPASLDAYRISLVEAGYKPATRNWHLAAARTLLHYARRLKLIEMDREEIGELLPDFKVPSHQPETLERAQIRALIQQVAREAGQRANRAHWYATLGLLTGLRLRELLTLPYEAVDLERREIRVYATKTERERRVPFHDSPATERLLSWLKARRKPGQGLLIVERKFYQGIIRDTWKNLLERAGLPYVPPKVTRATCAAYLGSSTNYSERNLRERFGHTSKVALAYYHSPIQNVQGSTVEELLAAAQEFNQAAEALAAD
jgi:integrase